MSDPKFTTAVCPACGKLFPVSGRAALCPWCHPPGAAAVEPLPLPPDAPPLPRPAPPPKSRTVRWLLIGTLAGVGVAVVAFLVSHMTRSLFAPPPLQEFVAPDDSCRVKLPGKPVPQPPPTGMSSPVTGGMRFATADYPARTGGAVGWYDLDPEAAKLVRAEDVIDDLKKARAAELNGKAVAEAVVRVDNHDGAEVRYSSGTATVVERYVAVMGGPRPRLYLASVGGPGFDADGETAKAVMLSLRVGGAN